MTESTGIRPLRAVPWDGASVTLTFLIGGAAGVAFGGVIAVIVVALLRPGSQTPLFVTAALAVYLTLFASGYYFALKRHGASWSDAWFRPVGVHSLLLMIPATLGLLIVSGIVQRATSAIFGDVPGLRAQLPIDPSITPVELGGLLLATTVAAPLVEEFVFRGILYRYLRARGGLAFAVIMSSLVFAMLHFVPLLIPTLFVFGAVLALVAERYQSIYPAIALHALNNGVSVVVFYLLTR